MLQSGRSVSTGAYRFGFNGMEQTAGVQGNGQGTFYDYKNRDYDPWKIRFNRTDALAAKYPMLTPYQFASNTPIQAIDLDGLEAYITTDGIYIGKPTNSTSNEVRIVDKDEATYNLNSPNLIHNCLPYQTLPAYDYKIGSHNITKQNMQLQEFLDEAHIMFGEHRGQKSDMYAHLMLNSEIEAAQNVNASDGSATKNGKATPDNSTFLWAVDKFGLQDAVLFSTYKQTKKEINLYKATLRETGEQKDNGVANGNYIEFFNVKKQNNVYLLQKKIPETKGMFRSIIDARLNPTRHDHWKNLDGWTNEGAVNRRIYNSELSPEGNVKQKLK